MVQANERTKLSQRPDLAPSEVEAGAPQKSAAAAKLELRLFGAFRKYDRGQPVVFLEVAAGATGADVKQSLCKYLAQEFEDFDEAELVTESALANDKRVLLDEEFVDGLGRLAILPPVCGG